MARRRRHRTVYPTGTEGLGPRSVVRDRPPSQQALALDTACIIYFVERSSRWHKPIREGIEHALTRGIHLVTSMVTHLEVRIRPLREERFDLLDAFEAFLFGTTNLWVIPVGKEIADTAARLRARYDLATPDAIHAATAIETRADAFVTNDRAFRRVPELTVVRPSGMAALIERG